MVSEDRETLQLNYIDEQERILKVYRHRKESHLDDSGFFGHEGLHHVFRIHERYQKTLRLLKQHGYCPLSKYDILDVGCGDGSMLRQFLQWGALPERLAGIELRSDAVRKALQASPDLEIRRGSAIDLPWPDVSFDLVCQHTVFTSILKSPIKLQIASEMSRVLRPGGRILWYDFLFNNPKNSDVCGVQANEIKSLFHRFDIHLQRITLAPFLARRIPPSLMSIVYPILSAFKPLQTHYLGVFVKAK